MRGAYAKRTVLILALLVLAVEGVLRLGGPGPAMLLAAAVLVGLSAVASVLGLVGASLEDGT